MTGRDDEGHVLSRWPLLLAASLLLTLAVGIDLTSQAAVASGVGALAAACMGAFLYAEGARMRDWHDRRRQEDFPSDRLPASPQTGGFPAHGAEDPSRHAEG